MKTKTILIALFAILILATSRANLINVGGFNINDPLPPLARQFFQTPILAGANIIDGQVVWSPFTIFGPNEFSLTLTSPTTATTSWNLSDTNGFLLRFVLVEGINGEDHLFRTNQAGLIAGFGDLFNDTNTQAVIYAGSNRIPDSGSTVAMMGLGILGLFFYARRIRA